MIMKHGMCSLCVAGLWRWLESRGDEIACVVVERTMCIPAAYSGLRGYLYLFTVLVAPLVDIKCRQLIIGG